MLGVWLLSGALQVAEAAPPRPVAGIPYATDLAPDLDRAVDQGDGTWLWTHTIDEPDAFFVKIHIAKMALGAQDSLVLRSASGKVIERLRGRGPKDRGSFWSLSAFGETMTLELTVHDPQRRRPFVVDAVMVGQLDPLVDAESVCFPADFEDAVCYIGDAPKWANVESSFGTIAAGENPLVIGSWCSGTILDPNGLAMTNNHCLLNQAECDDTEYVFGYTDPGCMDGSTPVDYDSYRCGEVLAVEPFIDCDAGPGDLDFTLTTIVGEPEAVWGWAEVDPLPVADGEDVYILQHPLQVPTYITHGGGPDFVVDGSVLRYYGTLDTEGGSSGSPIFRESDHKMIGLHHCGGCTIQAEGNRGMMMSDIYPLIEDHLCTADVVLALEGVEDIVEISGNADLVVDPGETWSFTPVVRNRACNVDAIDVTATAVLSIASAPVTFVDSVVDFGDVPAATVSRVPVEFTVDAGTACGRSVVLDLIDLDHATGTPQDVPAVLDRLVGKSVPPTTDLSDDFAAGLGGFTVVDGGAGAGVASTWMDVNPAGHFLPLVTAPFALVDAGLHGLVAMDESLITGVLDLSQAGSARLSFTHAFLVSGTEIADVDVRSSATGGQWVTMARWTGADAAGTVGLDISDVVDFDTEIRFRYHGTGGMLWGVDDVSVTSSDGTCLTAPTLTISGACPGIVDMVGAGFTPGEDAMLISGTAGGTFTLPTGSCVGTVLDLGNPTVMSSTPITPGGFVEIAANLAAGACGQDVLLFDLGSCAPSNLDLIP